MIGINGLINEAVLHVLDRACRDSSTCALKPDGLAYVHLDERTANLQSGQKCFHLRGSALGGGGGVSPG